MIAIRYFPIPTNIKELRSFLGLLSYCRSFVEDLAVQAAPLNELLKDAPSGNTKIELIEKQAQPFMALQTVINDTTKLKIPNYEKPFIVTTDASTRGLGGILAQLGESGEEEPVAFFSKSLSDAQSRYSATQLELLAVIEIQKHFKPYLLHKRFILRTDHKALVALKHTKNLNSMLFRWLCLSANLTSKSNI